MVDLRHAERPQREAELGALLELRMRQQDDLHAWRLKRWLDSLDDEDRAAVVFVPDRLAVELFRLLRQALVVRGRTTGEIPTPAAIALLSALHTAANRPARALQPTVGTVEVSVDGAAAALGCSPRRIRQLAAAGRLPGRKVGRAWLIRLPLSEVHGGQSASMDA
jgi:excisionase family DNA binding protein